MQVRIAPLILALALLLAACGGSPASPQTNQATAIPTLVPSAGQGPTVEMSEPTTAAVPATAAPSPATAATSAPTQAAASVNPGDAVLQAQQKLITQKVRVQTTNTDSFNNQTTTLTIELQPPDRIHMVQSVGEFIVIKGQGTWAKQGGQWVKSPVDMSSIAFMAFSPEAIQEITKALKITPAQFVGPDVLDGQPMVVYQYTSTMVGAGQGGTDVTGKTKVWVGVLDGLPHKSETDSPSLLHANATVHSVTTYQYDSSINIQPPT